MDASPPTIGSPGTGLKLLAGLGLVAVMATLAAWHDWLPGGYRLRTQFESDTARAGRATEIHALHRLEEFAVENPEVPRQATWFLGSSTIERFPLAECFPGQACVNRGINNADLDLMLRCLEKAMPAERPSGIVIYAGSVDHSAGKSVVDITQQLRQLVQRLRLKAGSHVPLACIGVLPSRTTTAEQAQSLRSLERAMMELARDLGFSFVPTLRAPLVDADLRLQEAVAADDRHLSEAGYRVLARWLKEDGGETGRGLAR